MSGSVATLSDRRLYSKLARREIISRYKERVDIGLERLENFDSRTFSFTFDLKFLHDEFLEDSFLSSLQDFFFNNLPLFQLFMNHFLRLFCSIQKWIFILSNEIPAIKRGTKQKKRKERQKQKKGGGKKKEIKNKPPQGPVFNYFRAKSTQLAGI